MRHARQLATSIQDGGQSTLLTEAGLHHVLENIYTVEASYEDYCDLMMTKGCIKISHMLIEIFLWCQDTWDHCAKPQMMPFSHVLQFTTQHIALLLYDPNLSTPHSLPAIMVHSQLHIQ